MLVTFLLLAILTIGAVSASDDGDELAAVDMGGDDSDIVESPACDDEILGNWTDSGMDDITTDGNSSGQSGEDYNIVFHEDEVYNNKVDGETPVVDIIVPEGSNGTINVTVEGNEWTLSNFPLQLLNVSDGIYYLVPNSFSPLDYGTYDVTVSYFEGENTLASESGTLVFSDDVGGGDGIDLWVNTDNDFSIAPEDLGCIFAAVTVPEGREGNVTFISDDRKLYNLALSDFDEGRIDRNNSIYNIALEVDGKFIFEGLGDGDWFKFAFLNENGDEIAGIDYHIFFGDNTVRFEVDAHNPGDHVSIDVNWEVNINDDEDFVWINLPSDVTEGKVMVTSGEFTLFDEEINFEDGYHWWKEIDEHYVCSFSPNSLTNWDKLNTGDIVTFAFLDGEDQMVESKDYKVTVWDDNARFEELGYIDVGIWDSDEMGTLYTDTYYTDIVWVDVSENAYGIISVMVNGEVRDDWGIEYEDGEDWAHHEWGLMDLGIFDEGDYNITVKHDDEVLREAMIQVVKDNEDSLRAVFILDRIRLFCPENTLGTVRITFEGQDDEGYLYPAADDFIYEISPEDSGIWIEWTADDLGIELYTWYRVTVNVEDDDGNHSYELTRWNEFIIYPEDESRIWYHGGREIIAYEYSQWELHNYVRYYHEYGETSIVSIYINNDGWDADPDYVFDYTGLPTGYYYISLNDMGIKDVGEYYLIADYCWGDQENGCDAYISVYEPQIVEGLADYDIGGYHTLTIEILPIKKMITGNVWDDYVIELTGEMENTLGYSSTIEVTFKNGTKVIFDLNDLGECDWKLGSRQLGINKEGKYEITVTYKGSVDGYSFSCPGTIRYLSPVKADLNMYNMHSDELYVGSGLDSDEYITFEHREENHLKDIKGNVSVYINGEMNNIFNIESLPKGGDQPENMYYFIPISMLGEIPLGNNTITVIYEGNQASVEKTQNFTAVKLTVEKFFEYTTIDIKENVYSDQVTPVKIHFSGNPMSADPLVWGKLILYVNGQKIDKTIVVFHEGFGNPGDVYGIYDVTDPEAIELMDKVNRNELEDWYYDRFDWLNLVYMEWYCDDAARYLSLNDLNITSEGVYNITLNYFGYDDAWDKDTGYDGYGSELRLISQNINYTKDDTHMKVVITPENKYALNTPSLINFELGNDYWNPSTNRTYNNVVVYINNTLAFNDTLVRHTYGDWDAQIKIFGGVSSNCLSEDILNEFGCLDEGNYHADIYMGDGGKLTEIASGDFAVMKQRGNMSFRIDTSVDLGEHAYLYADIPEGALNEYAYFMRIVTDDDEIEFDTGRIESMIGKGEVQIDLGILRKGLHVVYVELTPDAYYYDVSKNFYNNHFKLQVIGTNSTVTPETFYNFFDENGVLTSDADDLIFEGVFNNVTMTINRPVSLIGNGATFNDVSVIVESDDVSIENLEFLFTASEDADSYAVLVRGVSNFGMVNNTIVYVGKTDGTNINNAVRITDSTSVAVRNNNFMITLVSAAASWIEEPVGSMNYVSYPVSEGIVISNSRDVDFEDNLVLIDYDNVSGSYDTIYGVSFRNSDNVRVTENSISAVGHSYVYALLVSGNEFGIYDNEIYAESDANYASGICVEGPAGGIIASNNVNVKSPISAYAVYSNGNEVGVSYTYNTITAEGYFIFGIYDDSQEIIDNTITLTGNYTVGIVVLSEAIVENNKITLIASNVGNEQGMDYVPAETSGIVVRANASISNNEISSNNKAISLLGGSSTITDNSMTGYIYVASNDNTFTGNIVNATGEYAIDLGTSTGNVVTENELYANALEGDSAVNGDALTNEIYGNYPSNQTDAVLIVEVADITEGESETIEVTLPSDAEGTVTITVDRKSYTLNVIGGNASLIIDDLGAGSYEVTASYSGDVKYRATENTTTFTVKSSSKKEAQLVISAVDVTYGENLTIAVSAADGLNGSVALVFDGTQTQIILVGGTGSATFGNLNADTYFIMANFAGNDEFLNDSANATVNVLKADSTLNVSDVEFVWNAVGTVGASYTGATGLTANVVNQTAVVNAVNGTITISGLNPGMYTLNVATVADNNHNPVTKTASIKVSKAASIVAVEVGSQFNVGDEITITVTNSTACTVTVNNKTYEVKDGKVVIDSVELGNGTYEVIASIAEDEYFTGSSANATFTVSLIETSISVDSDSFELKVGENKTIVAVTVPEGLEVSFATGNDSVATVDANGNVKALSAGNAIIYVSVGDNVVYKYSSVAVNVTVGKIPTEIVLEKDSIDLHPMDYVEDAASLNPGDAGNLTFVSSDDNVVSIIYGVIVANGTGTATVTVSFAGDDKYAAAESKTITVTVKLKDASVSIENDTLDLKINERYDLNATTVPGFLNVEYVSSNESVASVTDYGIVTAVGEGTAVITLTVGNDITYAVNSTSVTVKVSKTPSEIVTANDSLDLVVGDEVGAPASLIPSDAGDLTYVISNEEVVKIVNATIVAVGAGSATVTYSFAGNDAYAAAESKTIAVTVSAIETAINVSKASYEMNVGDEDIIVVVTTPEGLNVNFHSFNSSVVSVDSDGKIVAVGEGNTIIYISFGDNIVYKYASTSVNVTVSKAEIPIGNDTFDFDENETVESKTPTYSINLPSDATGNLTVTINNKTYTAQVVNGKATVVVDDLPAGDYDVTVIYSGDDKYSPIVKTSKASVKVDPRIDASDLTVQHTAVKYYSVTVYGDDGKVASGVEVTFYLKGKIIATTKTDANGIAKFKITQTPLSNAKIKTVALGKSVTKKLTVKRVVSIKSITVKRTSKKIVLKATLAKVNGKYLVGKKITFKFNGKTFKAVKTKSKGIATLTITPKNYKSVFNKLSKTKKGKTITYSATYSKDTVKKTTKIK